MDNASQHVQLDMLVLLVIHQLVSYAIKPIIRVPLQVSLQFRQQFPKMENNLII